MKKLKQIGINARKAFLELNNLDPKKINKVLSTYNQLLLKNKKQILKENLKDIKSFLLEKKVKKEIIFVDDGSDDKTSLMIKNFIKSIRDRKSTRLNSSH